MWSSLPSNLRAVLGTALLLGIGVAAAAFTLSFFALRDAASDPALGWGAGHAWLFPIGIDAALIFFEVLLIGASMVRVQGPRGTEPYPRAVPLVLVLVAGAATLYFNATRVPGAYRPVALAVPVASILVTLGLAYLLKMLTTASGTGVIHLAPPPVDPRPIVRSSDVLQAEAWREQPPSLDRSKTGHTGRRGSGGGGGERGATTRAIEAVLGEVSPEEWTGLGPEYVVGQVQDRYGLLTTPGYVRKVHDGRAGRGNGDGRP
jgi:Protein of unknown function (DUF2637)